MIYTDRKVHANGPKNARLMGIGMAPAKWELARGVPFDGPSGRIFNDALAANKTSRLQARVTNLSEYYLDDNDLYNVPLEIMNQQRARVFAEIEEVRPNVLFIMGGDTLDILTAKTVGEKWNKKLQRKEITTQGSKEGITKWRGSIFNLELPSGRQQKCVASQHPANFVRGQWKWLPIFKYIDVAKAVMQSSSPELRLKARTAIVGPSFRHAREYLYEAMQQKEVSIDYEGRKHITCLGIGWTDSEAMCIPLSRVGNPSYWSLEEEIELWRLWCQVLESRQTAKIAQNASYEWIKSWMYGIYPTPLGIDTMHLHHCLYPDFGGISDEWTRQKRNPSNPGHGLALITSQYTDQPFYKDDGRHWEPRLGEDVFWRYNALDVMVTYEAAMKMREEAQASGVWDVYLQNYRTTFENALRIEWIGVLMDVAKMERVRHEKICEMQDNLDQLKKLTGYEVITKVARKGDKPKPGILNMASPAQMLHWITKVKHYKAKLNRKTGQPTVDKDTLFSLAIQHNDPSLRLMIKTREIQDFINDILDQKLDDASHIHCHCKIGGTNGTRWSTTESILGSGTNLQNLPVQGVARSLFLPG